MGAPVRGVLGNVLRPGRGGTGEARGCARWSNGPAMSELDAQVAGDVSETSQGGDVQLALIVGAARSGTTLLRLLLDHHPEIGCPPEAGIPSLIEHLGRVWWTVVCEEPTPREEGFSGLPETAKEHIRQTLRGPVRHYCAPNGKRLYCDKSLDSVHHLELVRELFPDVRCVLLFRHVMDTVASGVEASTWGFQAYGYTPFVQASPENFVAALANYWVGHVDAALRWEQAHPELCHRVRYEDLVRHPERTIQGICQFLGVAADLSVLERTFGRARTAVGPGDHKVMYTSSVHARSIGRGKRVPVSLIPPPLLEVVNRQLEELGYEALTRAWNSEPVEGRAAAEADEWSRRLVELMRGVSVPPDGDGADIGSFAVVAQDRDELRWVVDPEAAEVRQGDGDVESVVTGTAEDLVLMISREENPGVLLRSGRIRLLLTRDDAPPVVVARTMTRVLEVLSSTLPAAKSAERAA